MQRVANEGIVAASGPLEPGSPRPLPRRAARVRPAALGAVGGQAVQRTADRRTGLVNRPVRQMRSFRRARYLLESSFGRRDGWYVEFEGEIVGELTEPQFADMFWVSYAVHEANGRRSAVLHDDGPWNDCRFVFRSRRTGEPAKNAFAWGIRPAIQDGRVAMRALYLTEHSFLERAWIWMLRLLPTRPRAR